MKKIIMACLFLTACGQKTDPSTYDRGKFRETDRIKREILYSVSGRSTAIFTIDSCEYIWMFIGDNAALVHKGNCKNHSIK